MSLVVMNKAKVLKDTETGEMFIQAGCGDNLQPIGGGGAKSWNDLTDRPFGETTTEGILEFDGNMDGREYIAIGDSCLVKVSDHLLTEEDFMDSTVRIFYPARNTIKDILVSIPSENGFASVDRYDVDDGAFMISCRVPTGEQCVVVIGGGYGKQGGLDLSDGTYFIVKTENEETVLYTKSISCLTGETTTIKTLDEKYLPDSAATKDYVEELILGAIGGAY